MSEFSKSTIRVLQRIRNDIDFEACIYNAGSDEYESLIRIIYLLEDILKENSNE